MSLKELYEHGVEYLSFGGRIVYTKDGDNEYYDAWLDKRYEWKLTRTE